MKDKGANLGILKIKAVHCYMCGDLFGARSKKETEHHSIPKYLKPKRNVLIPICESCHQKINHNTTHIPKFKEIKNFIDSAEKFIVRHKKRLGKYDGE